MLTIFAMVQEIMSNRRRGTLVPTLQASPQALTRMLEEEEPINPALKLKMKEIFDRYEALVKQSSTRITTTRYRVNADSAFDTTPNFLRGEGVDHVRTFSPLELISAALLISYHMYTRNDEQLLNDVKEMRRHLRVKHKDLRVNAQCWTTAWEFILEIASDKSSVEANGAGDSGVTEDKYLSSVPTPAIPQLFNNDRTPRQKTAGKTEARKGNIANKIPGIVVKSSSNTDTVSALGQSGAGLDVNRGPNGTGQSRASEQDSVNAGPSSNRNNAGISVRRSARSSTTANAETVRTTVGMSTRDFTGHDDLIIAKTGKRNIALRVNTKEPEGADASDSSESLSSAPSSPLDSPGTKDLPVHSRKRTFDDGNNDTQGGGWAKKPKH